MNTHPIVILTYWLSYVSIQISSQKAQKHGSKGLSRVITWSGYKRNVICGIIEIKRPIIEEHSLYQQLKTITFPTNHYKPLVINNLSNNLDNLFYFWFFFLFLLFLFFFFSFFFSFSNLQTLILLIYIQFHVGQVTLTIHHDTWHKMPLFSPT